MKTVEKPAMKPRHARMTLRRRAVSPTPFSISSTETPEINERYAGISGITQGENTEISPAAKAKGTLDRNSLMA
jgi:hypothetical protein